MPSPKSGSAGSAVTPADPDVALEADVADPGEVEAIKAEQIQKKTGKYGQTPTKPHSPTDGDKKKKTSWIEIEMVDEDGKPVAGEAYRITLPDGETTAEGTLDDKGFARVETIDPGSCKITFPNLDKSAWEEL
jgi:type VI secretion system secreted protein VgrG